MPLPPVIGPLSVAAGPGGAGGRVVGVAIAGADVEFGEPDFGDPAFDDDEHAESGVNAATMTHRMTGVLRVIRGSLTGCARSGSSPGRPEAPIPAAVPRADRPPPRSTLRAVTDYADPDLDVDPDSDLETIPPAPLAPAPAEDGARERK